MLRELLLLGQATSWKVYNARNLNRQNRLLSCSRLHVVARGMLAPRNPDFTSASYWSSSNCIGKCTTRVCVYRYFCIACSCCQNIHVFSKLSMVVKTVDKGHWKYNMELEVLIGTGSVGTGSGTGTGSVGTGSVDKGHWKYN
eukprot:114976-Pelagomonas_calceolata.AAC.1